MLKFESLEVFGFKSFADKTRVLFDNRITAVVGPNGCGKSNLSDALGWAVGVQTAHGLRGQKMEDFIFNGTTVRKASGFSRVTLHLSRSGDAPLVIGGEEVADDQFQISRKLYRSGESQYFLNERRSRLKDIQRFIDESGLGFASYALIAQGKIDWFLNAKALERRHLIEEAAQISAYRSRRRSTEVKLELAQQNLLRVNDIVSEVERQLRSLKRQASKARRYRKLKSEFDGLLRAKFALESLEFTGRLQSIREKLARQRKQEEELSTRLFSCEREHSQSQAGREKLENRVAAVRQKGSDLQLELDRAQNAHRYKKEQVDSIRRQLAANSTEQASLQGSLEKIREDLSAFDAEKTALDRERHEVEAQLSDHERLVEICSSDVHKCETQLEELRENLIQLSSHIASLENQREQLDARKALWVEESQTLAEARSRTVAEHDRVCRERKRVEKHLSAARADLEQSQLQIEDLRQQEESLTVELGDLQSERLEMQSQVIAHRERLQSLEEVEVSRSQYSEGVQKLLKRLATNDAVHADGTLADFVETSPEFEKLVEETLDTELEYVLVDSLEDALLGVSEVRNLKAGKCTFMSLQNNGFAESHSTEATLNGLADQEGVFGTLADLLKIKPEVRQAFLRVLPQRAESVVVSDLDRAFQLAHTSPRSTYVTLEGETLSPSGLLTASSVQSKKLGLLSLKRKKRHLQELFSKSQRRLDSVEQKCEKCETGLGVVRASLSEIEGAAYQAEKELIGLNHRFQLAISEVARQERELAQLDARAVSLKRQRDEGLSRLAEAEEQFHARTSQRVELLAALSEKQIGLDELKARLDNARSVRHGVLSDQKVIEERRSALAQTLSRITDQEKNLTVRLEASNRIQHDGGSRLQELEASIVQLEDSIEDLSVLAEESAQALKQVEEEHRNWKGQQPEIEKRLSALRARKLELQEGRSELSVENARLETRLESVRAQCQEQLQMDLGEAAAGVDVETLDLGQVRETFQERRSRLDAFGPINMTALEEYQENEERHAFLTGQREDIERSISDMTTAIQDLNRRSRDKFKEAFDAINVHFKALFRKLFGGGDCGLRLLDEEDLLESGLDVFAQPPGKKLQHISLLSGGEKALAGLALLMALFQYRPSRFCILDEVDAPLDDANVGRFTALIEEMSAKTQFIIITHNKRTMGVADSVYGVTMEEPGVSQIVSVKF